MSADGETQQPEQSNSPVSWVEFLQEHPPGNLSPVTAASQYISGPYARHDLATPELQLYCTQDTCNGYMFFATSSGGPILKRNEWELTFLTYRCRNCRRSMKIFSVAVRMLSDNLAEAYKFGERPPFGPPVPPRALRLIQPDRELFLRGRRCENQSLGIGAFTYYRRVVENQWTRLIDEITKVAKAVDAPPETIAALQAARSQRQFGKSVDDLKDAIPAALLINGHNPLVLLHAALSQGVHNLPDDECLTLATSIRVVLVELAEKLGQALKDEKELSDAVSRLLQTRAKKRSKKEETDN